MAERIQANRIPDGLRAHFQEYDLDRLDLEEDADLIISRALEYGTWEEARWLFAAYGRARIRLFLRNHGERMLSPVAFHYWRRLLKVVNWKRSLFETPKGELWPR